MKLRKFFRLLVSISIVQILYATQVTAQDTNTYSEPYITNDCRGIAGGCQKVKVRNACQVVPLGGGTRICTRQVLERYRSDGTSRTINVPTPKTTSSPTNNNQRRERR